MPAGTLDLGNLIAHILADNTQFNKSMRQSISVLDATAKKMTAAGRKLSMAVTLPLAGIGIAAVKSFSQFDDAMTQSLAIMGDVSDQMRKKMEGTARTISTESITSSTELARSYFYLASAGMNAAQSEAALGTVEKFSVAGRFDMAQATDLLTDAQSALGLSSQDTQQNMEGLLKVSDTLVKANTLANATVQQFSESLTNMAGPAIKQYNMDLEEGVAILAAYADQGLKGNVAGSMMGRMVRLLVKSINENRQAFADLNIDVEEFASTGKNITGVIEGITKATEGMGPAQKAATLEMLGFQARTQQAILPLLGITDRIRGYEEELRKAGGITQEVADKQLKSFSSQMRITWNNVVVASQEIGNLLAPAVQRAGMVIKSATVWFRALSTETKHTIIAWAVITAAIGPALFIFGKFVAVLKLLNMALFISTGAIKAWTMAMLTNPVTLLIGAVVGAAAALNAMEGRAFTLQNMLLSLWKIIDHGIITIKMIAVTIKTGFNAAVLSVALGIGKLVNEANEFIQFFKNIIGPTWDWVWAKFDLPVWASKEFILVTFNEIKKVVMKVLQFLVRQIRDFLNKMGNLAGKVPEVGEKVEAAFRAMATEAGAAELGIAKNIKKTEDHIEELGKKSLDKSRDVTKAFTAMMQAADKPIKPIFDLNSIIDKMGENAEEGSSKLWGLIHEMKALQKQQTLEIGGAPAGAPGMPDMEAVMGDAQKMYEEALKKMEGSTQGFATGLQALKPAITGFFQETLGGIMEMVQDPEVQAMAAGNQQLMGMFQSRIEMLQQFGQSYNDIMTEIANRNVEEVDKAAARQIAIEQYKKAILLSGISSLLSASISLLTSGGKKNFKLYKNLAMAEAIVATYSAANKALNTGPVPNPALAAATIIMGLARVRQIAQTKIGSGGGGAGVGGGGGFGVTPKAGGRYQETVEKPEEEKKPDQWTVVIENVHGTADDRFADQLAESLMNRSRDGREFGFATISK